jgi:molybdopterin-guanine dinucleotide biosynthesis protein
MPIVAVAGLSSGVGKTHLIERLLDLFPGSSVLKATAGAHAGKPRIVTAEEELRVPGKDTWRYLEAGAGKVVWVSSGRKDLPAAIREALGQIEPGLLMVESNSALETLSPDVLIFVEGEADFAAAGRGSPKESAVRIRARADFTTSEPFDNFDLIVDRIEEVIQMSEDKARKLITERAKDNRLPCAAAFKIAEETGVPKKRIGELLNEMKVKVVSCQLGCF